MNKNLIFFSLGVATAVIVSAIMALLIFSKIKIPFIGNVKENHSTYVIHDIAKQIMEHATAEKTIRVKHVYKTTWLNSTKAITLYGNFKVKAGYDINDFTMKNGKITTKEPQLLSCEMLYFELHENSGVWNRITTGDRQAAINALYEQARENAMNDIFIETAEKGAQKILGNHYTLP